jgi:hypothetical protein
MIKLIGFDGPEPHSAIFWQLNGEEHSKTVCFSAREEAAALERFYNPDDFYHRYDEAVVVDIDNSRVTYAHIQKGA